MRAALWFIALFALAAAAALVLGSNTALVSIFWHTQRIDLSLNMALLLLAALFMLLHGALRGVSVMMGLPAQTRRWRAQNRERALHLAQTQCLAHLHAGRFVRGARCAQAMLELLADIPPASLPQHTALTHMAHLLAAECAHALQNPAQRQQHAAHILTSAPQAPAPDALTQQVQEAAQLRALRWALDDHDASLALQQLAHMPAGLARRTLALRMKLKAARLSHDSRSALDTARLLAKHGAIAPAHAASVLRGLVLEHLRSLRDPAQLEKFWASLSSAEQADPDIATAAATRLLELGTTSTTAPNVPNTAHNTTHTRRNRPLRPRTPHPASPDDDNASSATAIPPAIPPTIVPTNTTAAPSPHEHTAALARHWLLPLWQHYLQGLGNARPPAPATPGPRTAPARDTAPLTPTQAERLCHALHRALAGLDAAWLARIEQAQTQHPRNAHLRYLVGMACMQRQLWGKAAQHLNTCVATPPNPPGPHSTQRHSAPLPPSLRAQAWQALAQLAQQRNDPEAARHAWQQAAAAATTTTAPGPLGTG